jgi:hypothetical protein
VSEVRQYTKLPVTVRAIQWTGDNTQDVQVFTASDIPAGAVYEGDATPGELSGFDTFGHLGRLRGRIWVRANACWVDVRPGSWIVRDASGYYPCLPELFEETYAETPATP